MVSAKAEGRKTYREIAIINGETRGAVQKDSKDIETYVSNWVSKGRANRPDGKGIRISEREFFGLHTIRDADGKEQKVEKYVYVVTYTKKNDETGEKYPCESTIYEWASPAGSRKANNENTTTTPQLNH